MGKLGINRLAGLLWILFFCGISNAVIQAQSVLPASTYCNTDTPTVFYIGAPGDKTWTCTVAAAIVNLDNGSARFYPSSVPGPYPRVITILYQNPNYTGEPASPYDPSKAFYTFTVTVSDPPVVTFAAIANVCQTDIAFDLAPRGNPVGGIYAGPGVDGAGWFHPSVAGPGTHSLSYTYPTTGCSGVAYQFVTVQPVPVVTLPPFADVCIDSSPFTLSTGAPAGGIYTVDGVPSANFDPGASGVGIHTITYTYTSGLCTNSATQTIRVNALPVVSIGGLLVQQCNTQPSYTITGFPTDANGSFVGSGVTDNLNGTALFNPGTAGLGLHNIEYTYIDANGCTNSFTQTTRVGTKIFIIGLNPGYCSEDPIINFTYSPFSADPLKDQVSGPGVIDLEGGNATFNPATAGIGSKTITYSFTDEIGCINLITQNVVVYETPDANFSGLNASLKYCYGAADVSLTGTYAGGTFTGPAGSIVDNGNGTAIFKPSALLMPGIYSITYTYTNSSGCTDSKTYNIEILPIPTAYNVTGGGSRCEVAAGLPVGLSGSVVGINYQLYRDGFAVVPANIVAGTGAVISFGNLTTAGAYTVIATNAATGCTNQMTGNAIVTIIPQLAITVQPVGTTTCENGSASFTIETTGQNRNYQWFNDGVAVGIDNNVLVLNPVPLTDDGNVVYCVITSSCGGPLTSANVILNVNPNNKILTNPISAIKCTGSNVTFTVIAESLNPVYQWKKGAVNIVDVPGKISGSNAPVLSISNLVAGDAGLYSCEVTGDCGVAAVSSQATLTVNDPLVITTQPSSTTACTGTNTSFSVVATPATGLTYQWFFDNGGGFVPVGVNSPSHPINGVAAGNAGIYYCRISNACGAVVNTNQVALTVPVTTSITTDPVGDVLCETTSINLTVTAVGDALTYEWYKDADPTPLTNNAVVQNSSTSTLTLASITLAYTGNYRVKVTGTCGTETSSPDAVVTVKQKVIITSQPVSIIRCSGSDASFSVTATGDVLTYQWYNSIIGLIAGANTDNYTISGATSANAGNYWCVISTLECGTVTSSQATLTINPLTVITVQPTALKNACTGANVSFSVTATGVGLTYQWYKNLVSMGALYQTPTLSLNNIAAADAASYTCRVTGTCGPVQISNPGVLTVDIPAVISTHPLPASVCFNTTHELNIVLSEGTNPAYQWYFDNDLDGTFVPVGGATSQILTINTFDATEAGDYYCVVTNGCGSANSQKARLTLIDAFNITSSIADASVCENGNKTFTIVADQPVTYRWMKNGIDIPGATTQSLILNNIPFADNGAVYSCEVKNNCKAQIVSATLTVSQPLSITQQPQNGIACLLAPYSINIVTSGTNPQYQWYKAPATLLPGKTASSLSFTPFVAGDAGTYYCIVTNG